MTFRASNRHPAAAAGLLTVAALALLAVGLPTRGAHAAVEGFGSGGSRPTVKHMALMTGASGTWSDKYTIEANFKGGGDIYFSIEQGNFGSGDRGLKFVARYTTKDGTQHRIDQKFSASEWSQTVGDTIEIRIGRHTLSGTPKQWTMVAEDDEKRFETTFKASVPPWRPGDGRAKFGSDWLDMTVLAPRAAVSGTIKLGDTVREVSGSGYALHTYSTLAPYETAKRMVGVRTESGPLAFFIKELEPASRWSGAEPIRWLLIARKGKVVFETTDFTFTPAEIKKDTEHPNQYPVPYAFQIEAKDGARTLTGVIRATKDLGRTDRLAGVSAVERAVAAQFAQPVAYKFDAVYEVKIDEGDGKPETYKGRAIYELDHLNK
jgi:hypothetical protein